MKDYSTNSFERKSFILKYTIDPTEKTITIYYADSCNLTVPYSVNQEKILLEKMKNQVLTHKNEYNKALKDLKVYNIVNKIILVFIAIIIGITISSFRLGFIHGIKGLFINFLVTNLYLRMSGFRDNKNKLKKALSLVEDYEKNLAFINNNEVFSNARLMKPMILSSVPMNVLFTINSKILGESLLNNRVSYDENTLPLMDNCIVEDIDEIKDEEYKKQVIETEKEFIEAGYKNYAEEEKELLNINDLDILSYDDVYNTYSVSNKYKDTKGKVLTKVIPSSKGGL